MSFAKVLSKSLEKKEIRSFIKDESKRAFDGDYNFLFELEKEKPVNSSDAKGSLNSFADVLFQANAESNRSSNEIQSFLDSLSKEYPLLQISVPSLENLSVNDWDVENFQPLIAVVPTDYNSLQTIPAFDNDGNQINLATQEEPTQLVIVISENERVVALEKSFEQGKTQLVDCEKQLVLLYENDTYEYYYRSDYYDAINSCAGGGAGGGSGGGGGSGPVICDRDRKTSRDVLNKMIFNDMTQLRRVKEWFDGGLDIEINIFFATPNGAISKVTKFISGRDHDFQDCPWFSCSPEWFGINTEVVTWDKALYGSAMLYIWIEKDGGSTSTVSSGLSTTFDNNGIKTTLNTTVSYTKQADDDPLGESIVEYCDNTDGSGEQYTTGRIKFHVKQR